MVGDLLDLETELENIAQGFNQLQNMPTMPEDSWPSTAANGAAFAVQNAGDPFGSSFAPAVPTNGHIQNGAQLFAPQPQPWTGFSTPPPQTNGLFGNGLASNGLHSAPPLSVSSFFINRESPFRATTRSCNRPRSRCLRTALHLLCRPQSRRSCRRLRTRLRTRSTLNPRIESSTRCIQMALVRRTAPHPQRSQDRPRPFPT